MHLSEFIVNFLDEEVLLYILLVIIGFAIGLFASWRYVKFSVSKMSRSFSITRTAPFNISGISGMTLSFNDNTYEILIFNDSGLVPLAQTSEDVQRKVIEYFQL